MSAVVICASGPSLNTADCALVASSGLPVIAVNSTWRAVPECTYIYAGDLRWWDINIQNLPEKPQRWSCNNRAHTRYGVNLFPTDTGDTFNSGQRAILFAHWLGFRKIILLGFDCSIANGSHWHGDHARLDNPTTENVTRWFREFERVTHELPDTEIINCSRHTALTCFHQQSLESILHV